MWETYLLRGNAGPDAGPNPHGSSDRAVNAASRVFNTVNLSGMTREEVIKTLGDPAKASNSIYNFPFYPVRKGNLVYRFDNGSSGWQFDIEFDEAGKVRNVTRLGIE
jgi:hypothetical protein